MASSPRGPGTDKNGAAAAVPLATNLPKERDGAIPNTGPRTHLRIHGRVLYLTESSDALRRQLAGEDLDRKEAGKLIDNVSTDEITPGWVCYYYDETLARYCLVGMRGGMVAPDTIRAGNFGVLVSGKSKGCGSSRETAPYSELTAGIQLVIAEGIEKIYGQNAENIGLLTSTDFSLLDRIERGEDIPIEEFTRGRDRISSAVVRCGGLFAYNRARMAGEEVPPAIVTPARPMTLAEKIVATHVVKDVRASDLGVPAVRPGDALFLRTDVRFSHDYVTAMAGALFREGFGEAARVRDPSTVFAFRDHLTFLDLVMPRAHRELGLDVQARSLAVVQQDFATFQGIKLYGEVVRDGEVVGSEAICHNMVIEELALPGQVVVGSDSHTCMAGALGCLAFGVGSTDLANAWFTGDVRARVPETVRVQLAGTLRPGVAAKDVMLYLLALPFWRNGAGIGKIIEYAGPGVLQLGLDERATLTNMAVEAGAFTGIIEADEVVVEALAAMRGIRPEEVRSRIVRSDSDAEYHARFDIDLGSIEPMVAPPGDPRGGIPLAEAIAHDVPIDIAYGGSCTGGKKADMDMYANVLGEAVASGRRVADGVRLYIQFGSQRIRAYAIARGYLEIFQAAGATVIDPSCGACIKAGPGVSDRPDQVTVSAINRNFPGRSGPGQMWLASPYVVAASALAGKLAAPSRLLAPPDAHPVGKLDESHAHAHKSAPTR